MLEMLLSYISQTSADQDNSFFAMMNHVHRERMDDQRCTLTPSSQGNSDTDTDMLFKSLARSQGRRLDDQRITLPSLPGIGGSSKPKGSGTARAEGQVGHGLVTCVNGCHINPS
uniref:Uncharacterized protein n=1 Tax=Gadus morhua TaxID=8049 RepID=A0A8C5A0Q0_GADMO